MKWIYLAITILIAIYCQFAGIGYWASLGGVIIACWFFALYVRQDQHDREDRKRGE